MAIHVAITRRVRPGHEADFQKALREFLRESLARDGVLGVHLLTPAPGDTAGEYGILRTFSDAAERDAFYASPPYAAWLERVAPLVDGECARRELTGLEAWFRGTDGSGGAGGMRETIGASPLPPRWKMAVATLCGVYPTSLFLSVTVADLVHTWPFLLRQLVFAASMVAILTWLVMPNVTRMLRSWLHAR